MAEDTTVSMEGLDRAAVLAALYNNSYSAGLGVLHYSATGMSVEEAAAELDRQESWLAERGGANDSPYFDYLQGRVMKIEIPKDGKELNTWGYDRDNGEGAVAKVIAELRKTGEVNSTETQTTHREKQVEAIENTREATKVPSTKKQVGNTFVINLGIDDLASEVNEALDKASEQLQKEKNMDADRSGRAILEALVPVFLLAVIIGAGVGFYRALSLFLN